MKRACVSPGGHQIVYIMGLSSLPSAGHIGFQFATRHRNLVDNGWKLHFSDPKDKSWPHALELSGDCDEVVDQIAELIRNGPPKKHDCPGCKCNPDYCR